MSAGTDLIRLERLRQREVEKWTPTHDAAVNGQGQLVRAARCYALAGLATVAPELFGIVVITEELGAVEEPSPVLSGVAPSSWPWSAEWWKPDLTDPVPNLVKAGALIAAELDRLLAARAGGGR